MHNLGDNVLDDAQALSQAVAQVSEMLGLYRAELARILHLRCEGVGKLLDNHIDLDRDTDSWHAARSLVRVYQKLYSDMEGDEVAIYHWLRVRHGVLPNTPLMMMVDEGKIEQVLEYLETHTG